MKKEKNKVEKKPENKFKWKLKRLFFGVTKEFKRVAWGDRKSVLSNFVITVVILLFLALVFFGIDELLHLIKVIK
jgi:preprotein translocase SecE subunit